MPAHQQEKEVPVSKSRVLPQLVGLHIANVMVDRTRMKELEHDLDSYLKTLSNEEKQENRVMFTKQLTDGRLALESLLQRFLSS
jgi:hypothetical protein